MRLLNDFAEKQILPQPNPFLVNWNVMGIIGNKLQVTNASPLAALSEDQKLTAYRHNVEVTFSLILMIAITVAWDCDNLGYYKMSIDMLYTGFC